MGSSPFNLFVSEVRSKVKDENPNMGFGDLFKKMGEMWRELTDEQRNVYIEKSKIAVEEIRERNKQENRVMRRNKMNKYKNKSSSKNEEGEGSKNSTTSQREEDDEE